jgi:hypothetical protein
MIIPLLAFIFLFELQKVSAAVVSNSSPKDQDDGQELSPVIRNGSSSSCVPFGKKSQSFQMPQARSRLSPNSASFCSILHKPQTPVAAPVPRTTVTDRQLETLKEICVRAILEGKNSDLIDIVEILNEKQPLLRFSNGLFDDEEGSYSLLHLCAKHENCDAFADLLEVGVDPNLMDAFGSDLLSYVCEGRKVEFLQILLSYEPIVEARHIFLVVRLGFSELIPVFRSARVNIEALCGNEAMAIAVRRKDFKMIKFLLLLEY